MMNDNDELEDVQALCQTIIVKIATITTVYKCKGRPPLPAMNMTREMFY
jgi:hypothetical protein